MKHITVLFYQSAIISRKTILYFENLMRMFMKTFHDYKRLLMKAFTSTPLILI